MKPCPIVQYLPAGPDLWAGETGQYGTTVEPIVAFAVVRHDGSCGFCQESEGGIYDPALELVPCTMNDLGTVEPRGLDSDRHLGAWRGDEHVPPQLRRRAETLARIARERAAVIRKAVDKP